MTKVGDLSPRALKNILTNSGLAFKIGSFDVCLHTGLSQVAQDLQQQYGEYELCDETDLIDFHVTVQPPFAHRRWLRPQVNFYLDANTPFKPLPLAQCFAMFEWGLNWCIASNAHHFLNIHAAVVERDGRALVLPGAPGNGKSTLCAALVSQGWRLLSDEMTLVSLKDGLIYPVPRPISLKNESIDVIRSLSPDVHIGRVVTDTAKGTIAHMRPPAYCVAAAAQAVSPAFIVFPRYRKGAHTRLTKMGRGRALLAVADQSFNYHILGTEGFAAVSDLVEQSDCYEFIYENLSEAFSVMEGLFEV